jgi:hypothetical protein
VTPSNVEGPPFFEEGQGFDTLSPSGSYLMKPSPGEVRVS